MTQQTIPTAAHVDRTRELGARGEALAAAHLQAQGYRILARNWRYGRRGELDLIARDRDTIVAVEVKTRSGAGYGHPFESITYKKAKRLRMLLHAWVREQAPAARALRVDAIGIMILLGQEPHIEHLRGIA